MSGEQVARVYAQALFEAASQAGSVQCTGDDLRSFARTLDESAPLKNVLFNPQIDPEARRRVVVGITAEGDRLAAGALRVMLEKGRVALAGEVCDQFDHLAAEAARVVDVELTTAVPVAAGVQKQVAERVERSTGREARLSARVDPSIIGGLVLRIGDVIIDGSVRSRLRQLDSRFRLAVVRGGDQ